MGDMLSQAEIDALLNGTIDDDTKTSEEASSNKEGFLNDTERDALGEIGNISMGTSATTLYALLGQKVTITTPRVQETTWEELSKMFVKPYVAVKVQYTEGLKGLNLLIMKEEDVKIITDLMMGGDGYGNINTELNELHLSAISEAMNQMVGSAATSLSSMFEKRVEISPPESTLVEAGSDIEKIRIDENSNVVVVQFSLRVGNIIDSEIMQILPISFSKELVANLLQHSQTGASAAQTRTGETSGFNHVSNDRPMHQQQTQYDRPSHAQTPPMWHDQGSYSSMGQYQRPSQQPHYGQNIINAQPVQFQTFDDEIANFDQNNISLLMDVPLQIAVELGRTTKKIREILEFGQGSIIELDKLAGEPVDIIVNGKAIAKGEVVVIDESFGVRITEIIHPSKRI